MFPFHPSVLSTEELIEVLSSPKMSNDLTQLDLSDRLADMPTDIKTVCTQRIIPDDESSPLKYGKLRKLDLSCSHFSDNALEPIPSTLTQLTHLSLKQYVDQDEVREGIFQPADCWITDKTITTLLSTEHANPDHPYTSLPNLTHLDLTGTAITCDGLIQLSQSQLLDQLESLNLNYCTNLNRWHYLGLETLPPGLHALFTSPRVSNLKYLYIDGIEDIIQDFMEDHPNNQYFKYLQNCIIEPTPYV